MIRSSRETVLSLECLLRIQGSNIGQILQFALQLLFQSEGKGVNRRIKDLRGFCVASSCLGGIGPKIGIPISVLRVQIITEIKPVTCATKAKAAPVASCDVSVVTRCKRH